MITYNVGNSLALGRKASMPRLGRYQTLAHVLALHPTFREVDLVLLQEVHQGTHKVDQALRETLARKGLHYAFQPAQEGQATPQGQMIISRHPIMAQGFVLLPQVRPGVGRVALWVDLRVQGRRLRVYNLHLENGTSVQMRTWQLEDILRHALPLLRQQTPVILAGDFNSLRKGPVWETFSQDETIQHARQWFYSALQGYHSTSLYLRQLDWVFYRNLWLREARVVALYQSDHYPVYARFSFLSQDSP